MPSYMPMGFTQPPPGGQGGGGIDWGGIASAAFPWVSAALSTGGEIYSAQQNRQEAQKNRDFQERMSSSAVQRSVEDYIKAGLNPGLAYDRSSSSPGGAQATIGNPIREGLSSATQAKQLQMAAKALDADILLKRAQTQAALGAEAQARSQAELNIDTGNLARQTFHFNTITQPITRRLMEADAVIKAFGVPEARNKAEFEELLGKGKPGLASAKTFAEVLRLMFK